LTIFDFFRPRSPPRFRSAERDFATDAARVDKIRAAVAEVIAAIDSEAAGVERRLHEARLQAAGLFGNEAYADGVREMHDERLLAEAERRLLGAVRRLDHLKDQRSRCEALLDHVTVAMGARPSVIAEAGAPRAERLA
jgi:hypothetical protein